MSTVLTKVEIKNYKCFENHNVIFNNTSIIIGQNNAGKSTLVEVLRIICLASSKLVRTANYIGAPSWSRKGPNIRGIAPSLKEIDADFDRIFYQYGSPPAIIKAYFSNHLRIEIIFQKEQEVFVCAYSKGSNIKSKSDAIIANIPNIYVLPQIVPLKKEEKYITQDTIHFNQYSKRISGNFRSYLFHNKETEEFRSFTNLIEQTWHGIRIEDLYVEERNVYLDLRDRDFTAEIYYMGHGVQMWLQTMWFVSWSGKDSIIVLDEPDVYMHPDLQRKLIRLLNDRSAQTIIATHSIEIISEVEPRNIVIIDRENSESVIADEIPVVQAALDNIGSVHNISLSRLLQCKKYLYIEGDDIQILRRWHNTIFPNSQIPIDIIPSTKTGGWGSWDIQKNQAIKLKTELNNANIYFLYDKDYHKDDEMQERISNAKSAGIHLHIWSKKEIENYLISIPTIVKILNNKVNRDITELEAEIKAAINTICESYKEEILDILIEEHRRTNKNLTYPSCKQQIKPSFEQNWEQNKLSIVSGKKIISSLSAVCQEKYGVSINAYLIASNMKRKEIDEEVVKFLTAIENA
jgi:energy-coupling factor transporter ATP-binding protein EcfA2